MEIKYNRGFGFGSLVVIIALVLIVGSYIYYNDQSIPPIDNSSVVLPEARVTADATATEPPVQMETGDLAPTTASSTASSSSR